MKTKSEVEARIKELVCAELDYRVAEASKRLPTRCIHNYCHPLDNRKHLGESPNLGYNRITDNSGLPVINTIGLCLIGCTDPENWGGTICEEPIDAKKCGVFKAKMGKAAILPELASDLKDSDWVRINLPELFSLMWVLDVIQEGVRVPFWKKILFWFRRVRLEPVTPKVDTSKLLSTDL
jgi:hypothetical protein